MLTFPKFGTTWIIFGKVCFIFDSIFVIFGKVFSFSGTSFSKFETTILPGKVVILVFENLGLGASRETINSPVSTCLFISNDCSLIKYKINLFSEVGKTIKIYALFIEPIKVIIPGLLSSVEKITYPQIKEMEDLCREDYKKIYGKYPRWNFQENVEEWPEHIKLAYKEQVNNR